METFGQLVREKRLHGLGGAGEYSVRQVAKRIGVTPSFLSKVERGDLPPPSEETVKKLAAVLGANPDVLLALAGKVSSDLKEAIIKRPELFAELIRQVNKSPDEAVLKIVRVVRDGKW
jgi:transcriptional regulator with XRE-family HTH domain